MCLVATILDRVAYYNTKREVAQNNNKKAK